MEDNPAYCSYIFKNIYIEKYPGDTARVSSCCVNHTDSPKRYISFVNDPYLADQRARVKQGERIPSCDYCWRQEDQGTHSLRRMSNNYIKSKDPYEVELLGLDYNVEPICNAKCIICDSYFSSSWAAEDRKFGATIGRRDFGLVHRSQCELDLDLGRLERIYFNGGEPLLSDEMPRMLEKIKSAQNNSLSSLHVSFNTNGSIRPNARTQDLLQQAGWVTVNFSIDAIGQAFEYIRHPLSWREVETNLKLMANGDLFGRDRERFSVQIGCTVGVHNLLEIADLQRWYLAAKRDLPFLQDLSVHPCQGVLNFSNASDRLLEMLAGQLGSDPWDQRIKSWLVQTGQTTDRVWMDHLDTLDKRRDLDWRQVLPRLADIVTKK